MKTSKLHDAVGEIPADQIKDSDRYRDKRRKIKSGMRLRIGVLAACICILVAAAIYFGRQKGNEDGTYDMTCTDRIQALFFNLPEGAAEPESTPSGIWANPVVPGAFRTSITLEQAVEAAQDDDYFALKVEYAVVDLDPSDPAALDAAYAFFANRSFEAGIIDGALYLAATKAQIVSICGQGVPDDASVGAEFRLANPTEEQKKLESQIRY